MDEARVQALLALWERSIATLGACRAALDANAWDEARARAALDAVEPETPPAALDDGETPARWLSSYKEVARERRDVSAGTLPRSLVFVTAPIASGALVARWERHRWFLGAPVTRFFARRRGASNRPRSFAGYVRIERDPGAAAHASHLDEAMLSLRDVRFVLDRLTHFSRRSGLRVAVELRGISGWVDGKGCDGEIERACASLFAGAVDPVRATKLLDDHPDRRAQVADCGWSERIEVDLARTEHVLRAIDLVEDNHDQPAITALEAAGAARIYALLVERAKYRATGTSTTFTDVLDRLVLEHGASPIGRGWKEVTCAHALATWSAALTTSLAYETPLLDPQDAKRLAHAFAASFEPDALFFRNGDDTSAWPVLGNTFEKGAAVIDGTSAGLLFVGDED